MLGQVRSVQVMIVLVRSGYVMLFQVMSLLFRLVHVQVGFVCSR